MNLRYLKRALVQIATLFVVLVAAFLACAAFATHSGRTKAEALCTTVPVGTNARTAEIAFASADTDAWLRFSKPDQIGAGFHGAFMERWMCNVAISDGKVVGNEGRLVD
ncbi:MAG: hypothetical protein V4858_13070 [Pseudomonadota bacterium]